MKGHKNMPLDGMSDKIIVFCGLACHEPSPIIGSETCDWCKKHILKVGWTGAPKLGTLAHSLAFSSRLRQRHSKASAKAFRRGVHRAGG